MSDPLSKLGKYQVLEEIGRGGMGAVYKGYDPQLDRPVAIKLLAPHLAWEREFVERFLREARAAARLRHPNIIGIHDVGQDGDTYYFVMDFLPGPSLKQLVTQKGRLLPAEAMPILRQLAGALDYAHQQGLIHRDVKPANVIFDARGQAVLTDFGIAKATQETGLTATGKSIGSPHYMAPEHVQGQPVSARTDQYALGILAFEMLSGQLPFNADSTTTVLYKQVHEKPPSITELCPDLPPAIESALERALAKSPAERYASCSDLAVALELVTTQHAAQSQLTTQALPQAAAPPPPRQTRAQPQAHEQSAHLAAHPPEQAKPARAKTPKSIWLLGTAVTIVLLLAGAWAYLAGRPTVTPDDSLSKAFPAAAPSLTPTARLEAGSPATPAPALDSLPQIVFSSTRGGNADIYIVNADGGGLTQLTADPAPDEYPAVSPDGQRIAFQSSRDGNDDIYLMNRDGSGQVRLTFNPAQDRLPSWSPDGQQIVFLSDREDDYALYVMDVQGALRSVDGGDVHRLTHNSRRDGHPSWSTGGQIAFNSGDGGNPTTWEIYVIEADGSRERRLTDNQVNDWSPHWSPDGRQILFLSRRGTANDPAIWTMNADGSQAQLLYNNSGAYEWAPAWSPDGQSIAFTSDVSGQDEVYLLSLTDGNVTQLTHGGGSYPSWAP
ncbi:MAG: PD40 domain-containing protein [Thermoflexales bacterium]|nr:PD40 domain-containing protein [Thermoflexales bacterium]